MARTALRPTAPCVKCGAVPHRDDAGKVVAWVCFGTPCDGHETREGDA